MKRALAVGTALASIALLGGCGSGSEASLPGLTAAKLARIKAIARNAATIEEETNPTSVMVFAGRQRQRTIPPERPSPIQPIYIVVMRGHFVCDTCITGPAMGTPHSKVMTLALDRKTLQDRGAGITTRDVDVSKVGPGLPVRLG
jgi:hypothetical protein